MEALCLSLRAMLMTVLTSAALGKNIFITVTYGEGSHYLASTAFAAELVKRGHNVTYLISNAYANRAQDPVHSKLFHYEIFNHSVPLEKVYKRTSQIASHSFNTDIFNADMFFILQKWLNPLVKDCRAALSDGALMERLRNADFDITILDVTWGCSVLLNAYVGTPTVLFNPLASGYVFAELVGAPFLPAVVPEGGLGTPQKMNFKDRIISFIMTLMMKYAIFGFFVELNDPLRHEFGILKNQTLTEYLKNNVELVLTANDPAIDVIMPLPPNVIEVGGLLTRPAKPLVKKLDNFMNSSGDDGVIILSLGTYVKVMPQRLNDLFASVFAGLPQKVVWQLPDGSPTKLSDNIKTMGWLPQNDLLGHPKTRLLIYQGGNNGLYEALYHGVPILVLPVFADQLCVGSRVTEKGMGLSLDIHNLSPESLRESIHKILSDKTYEETAKRLSAIYRDRPETAAERAAFWVEHVMKFGGKYMESPAKQLSFIQLHLLDVIAFLTLCISIFVIILLIMCVCMFRCCRRIFSGGSSKVKKE